MTSLESLIGERRSYLTIDPDDRRVTWTPEIIRRVTPMSGIGNSVGRILLDAASRAEILGAGAGDPTLRLALDLTRTLLRQVESGESPQKLLQMIQNDSGSYQELIQVENRWPDLSTLLSLLEDISASRRELEIVRSAIDLAGLDGRIFVEPTRSSRSSVELSLDHVFSLSPVPEVVGPDEVWRGEGVRCLLVDGIVESVSEIHNLLEAASRDREPCILFCRGFTEEVIATLILNRRRGTLNVIPVPVPFDAESANLLKDVAVVLETDVVSALKGQLISTILWDDLPIAPEVNCQSGTLNIRGAAQNRSVGAHLAHLLKRRADLPADARRDILDSRIRSLSSSAVAVRLGGGWSKLSAQRIDMMLRTVRSIISYGIVDIDRIREIGSGETIFHNSLDRAIITSGFLGARPAIALAAVIRYGMEASASLVRTEAAILLDL